MTIIADSNALFLRDTNLNNKIPNIPYSKKCITLSIGNFVSISGRDFDGIDDKAKINTI